MARQRSLKIEDDLDQFIDDQLAREQYTSADEVVAAALKLLKNEQASRGEAAEWFAHEDGRPMTMSELREAIREGEESGIAEEVDFDRLLTEVEAELEIESAKR